MFEEGKKVMEIARACNLGESSVRCIRKNETKIKASASCVSSNICQKTYISRHTLLQKTKTVLYTWITDQRIKGMS